VCAQQEKPAYSSKKEAIEPVAPVKEGEPSTRQSEVRQPVGARKDDVASPCACYAPQRKAKPTEPSQKARPAESIHRRTRP
jgi:hypothetical protein